MRGIVVVESLLEGNLFHSIWKAFSKQVGAIPFLLTAKDHRLQQHLIETINTYKPDFIVVPNGQFLDNKILKAYTNIVRINWQIDDPYFIQQQRSQQIASNYHLVYTTHLASTFTYNQMNIQSKYLMFGVDPEVYKPLPNTPKTIDISFIGTPYTQRESMLRSAKLSNHLSKYNFQIMGGYGTKSPTWTDKHRLDPIDVNQVINRTKINLSFTDQPHGIAAMKCRLFELTAAGGFVLTQFCQELSRFFDLGREIATFQTAADLIDRLNYYMQHPDEAQSIANAGYRRTINYHTYDKRIQIILSDIEGILYNIRK